MKKRTRKRQTKRDTLPRARRAGEVIAFPCVSFRQGAHTLVVFAARAKQLWELVQINQRDDDKDKGYQRALSPSRVGKIARFIQDGNAIPLSVLISFDHAAVSEDGKTFSIDDRADAGWVIDGQHRLAGAHESQVDITLPVVGVVRLPEEQQINFFVTINREQKGVPTALYYDLLKHLPHRSTEKQVLEERAADLAKVLRRSNDSPFGGRIVVTTSPTAGKISLTNFVRKVLPHIKAGGCLFVYPDDVRAGILDNYYQALAAVFPKEYKKEDSVFFRTIGFGALMNVLPEFLQLTVGRSGSFLVSDAAKTLRSISDFAFDEWRRMGTGNAAEIQAGNDLREALKEAGGESLKLK